MTSFEPPTKSESAVASIIITSPSEGDSFNDGQSISISWDSSEDVGEYVSIELFYNDSYVYTLDNYDANDGSTNENLPSGSSYDDGYGYRIKIIDYYDSSVYGYSSYFSIY